MQYKVFSQAWLAQTFNSDLSSLGKLDCIFK